MPVTRRRLLGAVTTGCVALAGCTGGGNGGEDGGDNDGNAGGATPTEEMATPTDGTTGMDGGTETTGGSDTAVVEMTDVSFAPVRVRVDPGTTVEWVNRDGFGHDVTAARFHDSAAEWSYSESLDGGGRATYTFDEAGVYEYYCTVHSEGSMCGAVVVGDASLEASLPCESDSGGGSDGTDDGSGDSGGSDGGGGDGGGDGGYGGDDY